MIHKILEIQNCGRFLNYKPSEKEYGWNGIFSQKNTIYAENGSGKTTFTQILKSLSGNNCELVEKRKSLQSITPIRISILDDKNKKYVYQTNNWNNFIPFVEVYDSYYSESNIYIVSLGNYEFPSNFYDIIPHGYDLIREIKKWRHKRSNYATNIRNTNREIKLATDVIERKKLEGIRKKQQEKKDQFSIKVKDLENQLDSQIEEIGKLYIEKANNYLRKFNPNLEIKESNKQGQQLVYYININGIEARSDATSIPLKHTLSEGDKSSLSLSFFLARLDLLPNIEKRIIVFDDPISSFDTRRRMMTISILSRIAKKSAQFFLLSHDINFIKEFCDRNPDSTNLKIVWRNESSVFVKHNINVETMTGITKDIYTLQNYLKNGAINDFEKREIIRCIRPVIEGIFRFKYLNEFTDKEWLGNFLEHIRNSDKDSPLYRLNDYYDELSDINDYCKQYHHSNPKYMEEPIFDEELRQFVQKTLNILAYI